MTITPMSFRKKVLKIEEVLDFIDEIRDLHADDSQRAIKSVKIERINEKHKVGGESIKWLIYRVTVTVAPLTEADDIENAKEIGWRDRWV